MIAIGAVYRGEELKGTCIHLAITSAIKSCPDFDTEFKIGSSPAVNVVFHVPGSLGSFDWDGLRESKFSRQKQLLMVKVAVPESIVESSNPEVFIIDSLYGANAVAFEFFRQKNIYYPLKEAELLVASIETQMNYATGGP